MYFIIYIKKKIYKIDKYKYNTYIKCAGYDMIYQIGICELDVRLVYIYIYIYR